MCNPTRLAPRGLALLLPLLCGCAIGAGTDQGQGGAGGAGGAAGGAGGGGPGTLVLGLSAPSGDLVPGAFLDASLFLDGVRIEGGVEWNAAPRSGLGGRQGLVGVTAGGCGACARIHATRIDGAAVDAARDGFAEVQLTATYLGQTVERTLRLHDVGATAIVGEGRLALVATGPLSGFDDTGAGLQGLTAHGSVVLLLDLAAAASGGVPVVGSVFVEHEGRIAQLADDALATGFSVAGLTDDGTSLVQVREVGGSLQGKSVSARSLGFAALDAVLIAPGADCAGSRLVVASGTEAATITDTLEIGSPLSVKGLAAGGRVEKLFTGTVPDGGGQLVGFAVGSDGQVHPVEAVEQCNAGGGGSFSGEQPCEAAYVGAVEGGIEDAVFVHQELVATTGQSAYFSQSYATCADNAAAQARELDCRPSPRGLGAGRELAYGSVGQCGFQTVQLKQDPTLPAVLSLGTPCPVCAVGIDATGQAVVGEPLLVTAVRPFASATGAERLLVLGAPGEQFRVVDAPVNGNCPASCTAP